MATFRRFRLGLTQSPRRLVVAGTPKRKHRAGPGSARCLRFFELYYLVVQSFDLVGVAGIDATALEL